MRCLMWFREDLRITDNTALYHAARIADDGVIAVYMICLEDWRKHDIAACRVDFILRNLHALSVSLLALNIPLLVYQAATASDVYTTLINIIQHHEIDALFFNYQYEIDEARRDLKIEETLQQQSIAVFGYHDQTLLPPGDVLTASGSCYTVFTPFKKAWQKQALQKYQAIVLHPAPSPQNALLIQPSLIPDQIPGYQTTVAAALWPAGEIHAQQQLKIFITEKLTGYAASRDFPGTEGTSKLSPYLAAGVISARQCFHAALTANGYQFDGGHAGAAAWLNELIWREFYKHILYAFPRISMHQAFKLSATDIPWENDPELFAAWCEGRTGYPIIDAAMRQLVQTGWMHNRLRMLTAMFLVKDLLIDWRWGEKFFMQHLIDGDLAANNGGWQWSASTGTDAAPYFRIFNPFSQSRKFDPQGEFIKQFCPELSRLDAGNIHEPHTLPPLLRAQLNYPNPIVDHQQARLKALAVYKNVS